MADPAPATNPTSEPTPTPADAPKADANPEPTPSDDGKGGKSAILADLAKERDARQALERQLQDMQSAQQAQMDALAKAFGVKTDDPPSPEQLAEQVAQEQSRAREAAVQLAVYRNAATSGADPDALLDSASFLRSIGEIDPADNAAVTAAIKAAVDANPRYKAGDTIPSPGQAGIGVTGGGVQPTDPRAADLAQIEADLQAAKRR